MDTSLSHFHPDVAAWFAASLGEPTAAQRQGWPEIARGRSMLLSAPTGSGKTLAAFLYAINGFYEQKQAGERPLGLTVLYISPLRSLANDMRRNLQRPLAGLGLEGDVSVAVRNSDTPPGERSRMLKRPPNILLTTPESLFVLLTGKNGRAFLSNVKTVIVDELHAVLGSKRGTHLTLSLERLENLCGRPIQRIGLSATVKPPERAAAYLAGFYGGKPRDAALVAPASEKRIDVKVVSPIADMRALPEGTIWPEIFRTVYGMAKNSRTTLAFLNSRAPCEKLANGINELYGGKFALTHHGCVSREQRLEAEKLLKSGELRCLCATSSMELGIDVGDIDLVVQVAAPPTVAAGLQRLGRAGHSPGRLSVMRVIPRTAADVVACGFMARSVVNGDIEKACIPMNCLDVLAQHCVSMAASGDWRVDDMLGVFRGAYPYAELKTEELESVLAMLYGDYEHNEDKPVRPRLDYDRINRRVSAAPASKLLALLSGGTIPDRGYYSVSLPDGTKLGEVDEVFVYESRIGDRFLLGAFAWQIEVIERDRIVVRPSNFSGARSPFWMGDWMGREYEFGRQIGRYYALAEEAAKAGKLEETFAEMFHMDADASSNAARLIRSQLAANGCLQTDARLVMEHFRDETGGFSAILYSPFGGRVNLGLLMLMEHALNKMGAGEIQLMQSDDGILLHSLGDARIPKGILRALPREDAIEILKAGLPNNALFPMVFRYNAARALMMGFGKTGRVPLWIQRLRAEEALARAAAHPEHPLITETTNDCLGNYLDLDAIMEVVTAIHAGEIKVAEVFRQEPSPMTIEFYRMFEGEMMYADPHPEVSRAGGYAARIAGVAPAEALAPGRSDVERAARVEFPKDADGTHRLLMITGDLQAGDMDMQDAWASSSRSERPAQDAWASSSRSERPAQDAWASSSRSERPARLAALETLSGEGRAVYIEPGMWIAKEHEETYLAALAGDSRAMRGIIRRCLRYRGAYDAEGIAARYMLDAGLAQALLQGLVNEGAAVLWGELYCHRDVYEQASGMRRAGLRANVRTAAPEGYASYLARETDTGLPPKEALEEGLGKLAGLWLPRERWEEAYLPARSPGYRPDMLDALLQSGAYVWRLDARGRLRFDRAWGGPWSGAVAGTGQSAGTGGRNTGTGEQAIVTGGYNSGTNGQTAATAGQAAGTPPGFPEASGLTQDEEQVLNALRERGALFAAAINNYVRKPDLPDILLLLLKRGLVTNDLFRPARLLEAEDTADGSRKPGGGKKRAARNVAVHNAGRWEALRDMAEPPAEAALKTALERWGVLCRETARCEGLNWGAALEVLRIWEYTGAVRRGYFVKGLSGAQFVLADMAERVMWRLNNPLDDYICLAADDPAQAWGSVLPHAEERSFTRLPSTAVVLLRGVPVLLLEKSGAAARSLDGKPAQALKYFAAAFRKGTIWPDKKRITVKNPEDGMTKPLEEAGFARVMLDYVLYR
ncbi:MAG: DEAD/DEAH box helicase [Firmicutes bacterium]|nr:DEAD/DEAH box helicase [Bacillota bacterium]